jgi:hypothetical protein
MGVRKFPVIDGMKQCVKCEKLLPFTPEFYNRDSHAPGGLTAKCKECRYVQKRAWEILNPEKKKESERAYYENTKDSYLPRKQKWRAENREKDRASAKNWVINNPDKRKKYATNRYANHFESKIAMTLRARVRRSVKNGRLIYRNMENILGYSIQELINHLESTFQEGMSWDNYNYHGWHVDHIRPVSSFKLTNEDESLNIEEIRKCWALENLRALWGKENMIKSDYWEEE